MHNHWPIVVAYILTFGLSMGMLSAYWGQDEKRFGYYWSGLGCALVPLPIIIATHHHVLGFVVRLILLPVAIMLWREYTHNVDWREGGQGGLVIVSLLLLLL